jgi:CTP:molybdopterin cytidylyltransferase MocA
MADGLAPSGAGPSVRSAGPPGLGPTPEASAPGSAPESGADRGAFSASAGEARIAGLVLAAGGGSRMGTPKGLLRRPDGTPFVAHAARVLAESGAARLVVVVGAQGDDVSALVPADLSAEVVTAADWAEGIGASLRAGLRTLAPAGSAAPPTPPRPAPECDVVLSNEPGEASFLSTTSHSGEEVVAVVVSLVDTPGVTPTAVRRLVAHAGPGALARCAYDGVPGHPVLLGRRHWPGVLETAAGDAGARAYLRGRDVSLVEVGDVADGADVDTREQYVRWSSER